MIKEKERCIQFMRGKDDEVKKYCSIDYFTKADKKAIEKMDDERFIESWEALKANIFDDYILAEGLEGNTCIFCIYNSDENYQPLCNRCEYGENHGICGEGGDWYKIIEMLPEENDRKVFINEFYRNLLTKVEEI